MKKFSTDSCSDGKSPHQSDSPQGLKSVSVLECSTEWRGGSSPEAITVVTDRVSDHGDLLSGEAKFGELIVGKLSRQCAGFDAVRRVFREIDDVVKERGGNGEPRFDSLS